LASLLAKGGKVILLRKILIATKLLTCLPAKAGAQRKNFAFIASQFARSKEGAKNYEIQFSQRTPTGFTLSNHG
jgi:hypothetical protein